MFRALIYCQCIGVGEINLLRGICRYEHKNDKSPFVERCNIFVAWKANSLPLCNWRSCMYCNEEAVCTATEEAVCTYIEGLLSMHIGVVLLKMMSEPFVQSAQ